MHVPLKLQNISSLMCKRKKKIETQQWLNIFSFKTPGFLFPDIRPNSSYDGKIGIGDPGGACATCQLNTFGTAAKGAGKACKNMRVIYLLRSGEYLPIQINLPPTRIKPFKDFYSKAFALRRRAPYGSIVRIGLKQENNGKEDYSVATFRRVADFSGEKLQLVKAYASNFKDQLKLIMEQREKAAEEQYDDLCEVGGGNELPLTSGESFTITPTIDGERDALPD